MKSKFVKKLVISAGVFESKYIEADTVGEFPPDNIIIQDDCNYLVEERGLTDEEVSIALIAKQTIYLKTIKNIVLTYFIISLAAAVITAMIFYIK